MSERQIRDRISEVALLVLAGDEASLRPFELSPNSYALLSWIDSQQRGLRQVELADRLLVDTSTVTRLIDRLERRGLVARSVDPSDRRALRVVATAAGRERRRRAQAALDSAIMRRLGGLSQAEQQQLVALLEKLRLGLYADLAAYSAG